MPKSTGWKKALINRTVTIRVKTPAASEGKYGFKVTPVPRIDTMTPSVGYGPSPNPLGKPYYSHSGTYISLNGEGMRPPSEREDSKVIVGTRETDMLSVNESRATFYVPDLPPGDYDVYIKYQKSDLASWGESIHNVDFRHVYTTEL